MFVGFPTSDGAVDETSAPSTDDAGTGDDGDDAGVVPPVDAGGVAPADAGRDTGAGPTLDAGDGSVADGGRDTGVGPTLDAGDSSVRDSGPDSTVGPALDAGDGGDGAPGDSGSDSTVGPALDAGDGATARDSGIDSSVGPAADGGDGGGDAASDGGTDSGERDAGDGSAGNPLGRGPAAVNIGSSTDLAAAGSYALLAKMAITNATGSSITGGNLGLSPAAASFVIGFGLTEDSSNTFSTSASVVPPAKVYAADYAPPTPSNLTSAVLSMQAAYTDAAGRSNPDFLNLNGGNLGGLTLAPGLYTWGTDVTVPTDVTISGAANDVWIFQISNNLDVSSAKNVVLAGGAQARNIFWQVAGQATIQVNAHFEGIILSKTGITLQTTATMHGRALAQTLIALDNNAVTAP